MKESKERHLNFVVLNQRYVECTIMSFNLVVLNMSRGKLGLKRCQKREVASKTNKLKWMK